MAKDRIVSIHDPEMRHGRKSAQSTFDGYKAAIAVDTETKLISAVGITAANQYDGDTALPLTEATEEHTGREVEVTVRDAAFGDEATRRDFAQADRHLVAKVPRPPRSGQLPKEAFRIDLDQGTCTCPAGQVTSKLKPTTTQRNRRGERLRTSMFQFDRGACDNCPLKSQCTGLFTGGVAKTCPGPLMLPEQEPQP